jgi:hypothetical protein
MWKPASFYGSPESYYLNTWDQASRLYATGEYPWRGRYEPVQPFMQHEYKNGKLIIQHMELNHFLIDKLLPILLAFQKLTKEQQEAARRYEEEQERKREVAEIADRMADAMPAYLGPVSFSRQGIRTSLLDRKMQAIQKHWDRLFKGGKRPQFQKGFYQGSAPVLN